MFRKLNKIERERNISYVLKFNFVDAINNRFIFLYLVLNSFYFTKS